MISLETFQGRCCAGGGSPSIVVQIIRTVATSCDPSLSGDRWLEQTRASGTSRGSTCQGKNHGGA
eukprot:scaffold300282_cov24-Attheya_sp.AAC.1